MPKVGDLVHARVDGEWQTCTVDEVDPEDRVLPVAIDRPNGFREWLGLHEISVPEFPRTHGNCIDGECERCNEAEPWTPKPGDRVRVKSGHHFVNRLATVKCTAEGVDKDLTVINLASPIGAFEDVVVATASLEPAKKPHISDVVGVTVKRTDVPPRLAWNGDISRVLPDLSAEGLETETPDQVAGRITAEFFRTMVEDCLNYRGSEPRADGHSTGPILTGDARESYLAIQSGAEDPHAKPEPVTEPACAYCKDTGIGVMGMECPVRTCEAVST